MSWWPARNRTTGASSADEGPPSAADEAVRTSTTGDSTVAFDDRPTSIDKLQMAPYAVALAEFLLECPTPMTVAIQGDWGSGKTSTIEMVWKHLAESTVPVNIIDINTWQYAQLNLGDDLVFHLLDAIVDRVSSHDPGAAEIARRCLQAMGSAGIAALKVAASTAAAAAGPIGGNAYTAAIESLSNAPSAVKNLEDLHEQFATLIGGQIDAAGGSKRVVLFVDDLDRLPPDRAVEVMEVLKTLLECHGCVFVLAIDFEVVSQGVHLKYGSTMDPRKARAYFDKMIQLPFDMPVGSYDIKDLLAASLHDLRIELPSVEPFVALARCSVGTNPRALKRLLNSFSLLRRIAHRTHTDTDSAHVERISDVALFALLALQTAHPTYRNDLQLANIDRIHAQLAEDREVARDPNAPDHSTLLNRWDVKNGHAHTFADLLDAVSVALPQAEGEELARILQLTSITAVRPAARPAPSPATSAVPLEDRRSDVISTYSVSPALATFASDLETALEARLKAQGRSLSATQRANKPLWVWWASEPDERPHGRFCEIFFGGDGSLSVTFAFGSKPEFQGAAIRDRAIVIASENGWAFAEHPRGDYQRILKILPGSSVDPLVDLLLKCHVITSP